MKVLGLLGLLAALAVGLATNAFASHVQPVVYGDDEEENNPNCAFLNSSWSELKIDQAPNGEFEDGPLMFTVKDSNGETFNWESNIGVDAIVVKGGNRGSNVYVYDPEETSDTGLRSPDNSKGNRPAISHISVCYDGDAKAEQPREQEQPQEEAQPQEEGTADRDVYGDAEGEENNPTCESFGRGWNELKIDQAPNGEYRDTGGADNPGGDGPLVFTVKNSDGKLFDWESNIGVDAIVVKGGNRGSSVYFYDPEQTSGERLRSPDNTQGNVPAISHISVCYDSDAQAEQPRQQEQPKEEEQPKGDEQPQEEQEDEPQEDQPQGEEPQGEDQPEEETDRGGTNERQADQPEDEGTDEVQEDEATEETGDEEGASEEDEAEQGEGDVEGISETDEGGGEDVPEETAGGSDSGGGDLPFTGAPVAVLVLLGFGLMLAGLGGRRATRD